MADYTTLAKVKTYLGIKTSDTTRDAKLSAMIPRATAEIDGATGRNFQAPGATDTTEYFKIRDHGIKRIYPKNFPIVSVTSLAEDTLTLTQDLDYTVGEFSIEKLSGSFIRVPYKLTLKYKGGFTTVPADIEQAANEIVAVLAGEKLKTYTTNEGVEQTVFINSIAEWVGDTLKRYAVKKIG